MTNNWKKTLLSCSSTILDALKIINMEALRVAIVVDEVNTLMGIVTDGDVRRGLLKGISLSESVTTILNQNPITLPISTSRETALKKMQELDILFIPLVDGANVVGLVTLHDSISTKVVYHNPVFIMAGGFGTRLKPLTDNCPKPMLKIGDKPILETVINSFINAGFINFYISTHYLPEMIKNYFGDGSQLGIKISYIYESTPLGTGGALGLLPKDLPKDLPLLMINGDVLTKVDFKRLLEFHVENEADATMCVREFDYQIPYGVINSEGNKIIGMEEKPIQRFFVNAGIYVVSPIVIESVSPNQSIDMPTLLEQHISERDNVMLFPIHEYWLDIGRMDDFKRAQVDIRTLGFD